MRRVGQSPAPNLLVRLGQSETNRFSFARGLRLDSPSAVGLGRGQPKRETIAPLRHALKLRADRVQVAQAVVDGVPIDLGDRRRPVAADAESFRRG